MSQESRGSEPDVIDCIETLFIPLVEVLGVDSSRHKENEANVKTS